MSDDVLRLDVWGELGVITLRRPEQLNALNTELVAAFRTAVRELAGNTAVRCVLVTGEGRAFSAGADVKEIEEFKRRSQFRAFIQQLELALQSLEVLPQPTIAAINGIAFGGGLELALACDLRIADPRALLGLPEIKLGLLPGAGGTQRLPRLVPAAIAKHMLFTGDPITAEEAHRVGLVNEISDEDGCLLRAVELGEVLAERAPLALAAAKELVDHGRGMALDTAIALERETVAQLFDTEDRTEGVAAFLARRAPEFRGR